MQKQQPERVEFDYSELSSADREWLRRAAERMRVSLRKNAREVVVHGKLLSQARRRVGSGRWIAWLEATGIHRKTAQRYLSIDRAFGNLPPEILDRFTPSALLLLASSAPQSIKEYAVEQATDGVRVTEKLVELWIREQRASPDAPLSLAPEDPKLPTDVDPARAFAAENWLLLDEMLGGNGAIHLAANTDEENDLRTLTGTLMPCEGPPRHAAGKNLENVVLALARGDRRKECRKCKEQRPLFHFSELRSSPDGRNARCLFCERARVKAYEASKRSDAVETAEMVDTGGK